MKNEQAQILLMRETSRQTDWWQRKIA